MAFELATSPGYQEMMLNPLMSALLPKIFNTADKQNKTAEPEKKETPAPESPKAELSLTQDPNLTNTSTNDTSEISPGDSVSEAATKLYNFVIESYEYDNKQAKKDKEYRELLVKKKEKRVKQLIGLFKVDKVKKSKVDEEVKKKESESKSQPKTENKATTKVTEPPISTTPSATKAPSVAGTIVKGVVGAGLAATAASAIGGAESGGNYNITFGDKLDKNKNVIRGSNLSPEKKFGKDLTELTLEEVDMLGKERNREKMNTSAMGKYQFMNSTLFGYKDKGGVFRPGLVQRLNLDMKTTKFTPEVQEKLYSVFRQDNLNTLQKLGVPITPGYEYMAHYLGAGGAKAIYDRRNTDMTVQRALVDAGLKDPVNGKVNEELTRLKAADFELILESRLKKHGLEPHAEGKSAPAVPSAEATKPEIPNQMKKTTNSKNINMSVTNNNMNVVKPATTYQIPPQNQSNQPQLVEKQYNGN
jgi:hypothetical protein